MYPVVGQRWRYKQSNLDIIVEIITGSECIVIQNIKISTYDHTFNIGTTHFLTTFAFVSSKYEEYDQTTYSWSYLTGQDKIK